MMDAPIAAGRCQGKLVKLAASRAVDIPLPLNLEKQRKTAIVAEKRVLSHVQSNWASWAIRVAKASR
jgi:hypothetical protein